MKKRSKET